MALRKKISFSGTGFVSGAGFSINTGETTITTPLLYIKVVCMSGDKEKITFSVAFKDEETGAFVKREDHDFNPNMDGSNFIKQAYAYLKTLPEFEDAEDC